MIFFISSSKYLVNFSNYLSILVKDSKKSMRFNKMSKNCENPFALKKVDIVN